MSRAMTIKVHEITEDGIPDLTGAGEDLVGRVAFIFDGCIVSGWPLVGPDGLWEANGDVGHNRPFAGVTHWIEFPEPIYVFAPTSNDYSRWD